MVIQPVYFPILPSQLLLEATGKTILLPIVLIMTATSQLIYTVPPHPRDSDQPTNLSPHPSDSNQPTNLSPHPSDSNQPTNLYPHPSNSDQPFNHPKDSDQPTDLYPKPVQALRKQPADLPSQFILIHSENDQLVTIPAHCSELTQAQPVGINTDVIKQYGRTV